MIQGIMTLNEPRHSLGDVIVVSETGEPAMKYLLYRASDLADVTGRTR